MQACKGPHPGVLDQPVGLAALRAVANYQHAVVQSGAALAIEDAAVVQLELPLVCLNGHRDWLVRHCLQGTSDVSSRPGCLCSDVCVCTKLRGGVLDGNNASQPDPCKQVLLQHGCKAQSTQLPGSWPELLASQVLLPGHRAERNRQAAEQSTQQGACTCIRAVSLLGGTSW